jgi:hypothetical protein
MVIAHETETESDPSEYRYRVRLLIRHPHVDPARITHALGLDGHYSARAGSARKSPNGDPLPGLYKTSFWTHSFHTERNRRFFSDIEKMITRLESYRPFLAELVDGGGSIQLIVHLRGTTNIGDTLPWRDMARLSALQIDLGIEVFPDSD